MQVILVIRVFIISLFAYTLLYSIVIRCNNVLLAATVRIAAHVQWVAHAFPLTISTMLTQSLPSCVRSMSHLF
jgi:hypothetical protein